MLLHNNHWNIVRKGDTYWLIAPPDIDPKRTPRRLWSKSAVLHDLQRERRRKRREQQEHERQQQQQQQQELQRDASLGLAQLVQDPVQDQAQSPAPSSARNSILGSKPTPHARTG